MRNPLAAGQQIRAYRVPIREFMEIDEIPLNPRGYGRNLAARLRAVDLRSVM